MLFLYCENVTFPNKTLLIFAHSSILDFECYILFQPKIGENQRAFQACALLTFLLSLGLVVYLLLSFIFPKFLHWLVQINMLVVAFLLVCLFRHTSVYSIYPCQSARPYCPSVILLNFHSISVSGCSTKFKEHHTCGIFSGSPGYKSTSKLWSWASNTKM